MDKGGLIISLDFELYWGVMEAYTLEEYGDRLEGTRLAVEKLLDIFTRYDISATWATVGMLACNGRDDLMENLPSQTPSYNNKKACSIEYAVESTHLKENLHFAPDLVTKITQTKNQELGTHTFSHFYTQEPGQTKAQFRQDIKASEHILQRFHQKANEQSAIGLNKTCSDDKQLSKTNSIVFPRDQINTDYLDLLADFGISNYRTPPDSKHFDWSRQSAYSSRIIRLLDSYINLTGSNTFKLNRPANFQHPTTDSNGSTGSTGSNQSSGDIAAVDSRAEDSGTVSSGNDSKDLAMAKLVAIPASKFLRPYNKHLGALNNLQINRISKCMEKAAKEKEFFHLWWHPHNFGKDQDNNFQMLENILENFSNLRQDYGIQSHSMSSAANLMAR